MSLNKIKLIKVIALIAEFLIGVLAIVLAVSVWDYHPNPMSFLIVSFIPIGVILIATSILSILKVKLNNGVIKFQLRGLLACLIATGGIFYSISIHSYLDINDCIGSDYNGSLIC